MKRGIATAPSPSTPILGVHVTEKRTRSSKSAIQCHIGQHVQFSTASLESYFFTRWEPVAYDSMLVAAAVEFADRTQRRPVYTWRRHFELRIPVHDLHLWKDPSVENALRDALEFLTGDIWCIEFYARRRTADRPHQGSLSLDQQVQAVIPFSNGLDSCAVAGLMERQMGSKLVRIRLGSILREVKSLSHERKAFTAIPYSVRRGERPFVESSDRSRGFKFALISGLAAYLANAGTIIVPESGQGALGPSLVTVGQAYEDYRSHPLFARRMEIFLQVLLGYKVRYEFPHLWSTKAETLRKFVDEYGDSSWLRTKSCWQQNRHVTVDKKWRQCGICAACMLRRMSVHAAGLQEPNEAYVWENLSANTFNTGAAASFEKKKITNAMREHAIAGTLHLDHLAGLLDTPANTSTLNLVSFQLSGALGLSEAEVRRKLDRLLRQHSREWQNFMSSLGQNSFLADWALSARL
jgi:hypothetical protein